MFGWLTQFGVSRFLSLVIAAGYLSIVLFMPGHTSFPARIGAVLVVAGYLLIPLLCILFGDEMGNYIGTLPGPAINKSTPGCLVSLGGWVLLLLPLIVFLIMANQ
jgi:hypothetical protein